MLGALRFRPVDAPRPVLDAGTHAVIGGEFDDPRIFRAMIEASARGTRPRIAVILSSKDGLRAARAAYFRDTEKKGKIVPAIRRWFDERGFEPVYVPLNVDTAETWAHDRLLAQQIASCDAVYLCGGDQSKHVRCLLDSDAGDTAVMRAIRSVAAKGGLVSGSSAGAAVQGGLQYGSSGPYSYLVHNRLVEHGVHHGTLYNEEEPEVGSLQRGLSLLRDDVLVCTHFDQRARLARLLVALRHAGEPLTGIGVDEDTGLFVKGSEGRVVGNHGVWFADPSQATYGEGPHFSVEGVRLTYVTHGDRIDVDTHEVTTDKPELASKGGTVASDDILSKLALTRLIEEMIRTGADRAVGTTKETDPRFEIEILRDARSRTYAGDQVAAVDLIANVRVVDPKAQDPRLTTHD